MGILFLPIHIKHTATCYLHYIFFLHNQFNKTIIFLDFSSLPAFHRSPTDSRNKIWSSELTRHLQFDLVDTAGMTEDQLKEIPYTVVETTQNTQNRKRNSSTNSLKVHKNSYGKDRVDRIRG